MNSNWRPSQLDDLDAKWSHVSIPDNLTPVRAEELMLRYLQIREDWTQAYVDATYYENICDWKHESAYKIAFFRSDAKSDKGRDLQAKDDPLVRAASLALAEAKAAVIKAKLKVENATLSHHAMKKIFEESSQERRYL